LRNWNRKLRLLILQGNFIMNLLADGDGCMEGKK